MIKRKVVICLIAVLFVSVIAAVEERQGREKQAAMKTCLAVGVFDSRAVAIAYANSAIWGKKLKQMEEQLDKARAAGDAEKVKELEQWGREHQEKAHMQAFGTADVSELLEAVKDQIPIIAKNAGIDVIVSKWSIVYQTGDVNFIDVTAEIVKAYNPSEKALKWIDDLKNKKPVPLEELEKMDHTKF